MAAEFLFTVAHIVMNAWVEPSFGMFLVTVFFAFAFFDRKLLVGTNVLFISS